MVPALTKILADIKEDLKQRFNITLLVPAPKKSLTTSRKIQTLWTFNTIASNKTDDINARVKIEEKAWRLDDMSAIMVNM